MERRRGGAETPDAALPRGPLPVRLQDRDQQVPSLPSSAALIFGVRTTPSSTLPPLSHKQPEK